MDMTRFKVVIAFVYLLALIPASVYAQGDGTGLNASFHISEVRIVFMEDTIAQSSKDLIRSSVLNKLKVFPHDYVRRGDLDRAMLSLGTIPEISSATYDLELSQGQSFVLYVKVSTKGERVLMEGNTGIFSKNPKGSFPYLFRSKNFIAKLDIGVGASVIAGDNTWLVMVNSLRSSVLLAINSRLNHDLEDLSRHLQLNKFGSTVIIKRQYAGEGSFLAAQKIFTQAL
jgi:hypothetical protein